MPKKLTKDEFINKANIKFNNKFDYSKVEYIDYNTEVIIICPIHGEIKIKPKNHINSNYGCEQCSYDARAEKQTMTKEEFIAKSIEKFGNKFDYSKIIYKGFKQDIIIICPIHGEIITTPRNFLMSEYGCSECGIDSYRMTNEEFIVKARKVHGIKYDYSKTDLTNRDNEGRVIITCPKHGDFKINPYQHLKGSECKDCHAEASREKRKIKFIKKANLIHMNKYDYSKVEYINAKTDVIVICPKHGAFKLTPDNHTHSKEGCPFCNQTHLEETIYQELKLKGIDFEYNKKYNFLEGLQLDFYIPSKRMAIECQGRQHFLAIDYFGGEEGLKETKKRDAKKFGLCKANGIKLLYYSNLGIEYPYEVFEDKKLLIEEINKN